MIFTVDNYKDPFGYGTKHMPLKSLSLTNINAPVETPAKDR